MYFLRTYEKISTKLKQMNIPQFYLMVHLQKSQFGSRLNYSSV